MFVQKKKKKTRQEMKTQETKETKNKNRREIMVLTVRKMANCIQTTINDL